MAADSVRRLVATRRRRVVVVRDGGRGAKKHRAPLQVSVRYVEGAVRVDVVESRLRMWWRCCIVVKVISCICIVIIIMRRRKRRKRMRRTRWQINAARNRLLLAPLVCCIYLALTHI